MAFVQLTYRECLRDIEVCLRAQQAKLYHTGIRGAVSIDYLKRQPSDHRFLCSLLPTMLEMGQQAT
jgi:hypothetical protein